MEDGKLRCGCRNGRSSWPRPGVAPCNQEFVGDASSSQLSGSKNASSYVSAVGSAAARLGEKRGRSKKYAVARLSSGFIRSVPS